MKVKFNLDELTLCKYYHLLNIRSIVAPELYKFDTFDENLNDYGKVAFTDMLDADIRYFSAILTDQLKGEEDAKKNET